MKRRISAFLLALSLCLSMAGMASAYTIDPDYGPQPDTSTTPDPGPDTPDPGPDKPDPSPSRPSGSGSGSSTGGGHSGAYTITVPARIPGGSVTSRPASADKGDKVTLTVKPNAGYELDKLTVTDRKGNVIELTDEGDGKYSFIMPGSRVSVEATFKSTNTPAVSASSFVDVEPGSYYAAPVAWAVAHGITAGTSATTFSPNSPCTRGQIMTFLWRAAGSPTAEGNNPFTDVQSTDYYAQAVQWAVAQGITSGTSETTFSPNATCTRAQAMAFLYKAKGSPAYTASSSFTDVSESDYFYAAVQWAVENGVTSGTSATTFGPNSYCTRAQIVTFLHHAFA